MKLQLWMTLGVLLKVWILHMLQGSRNDNHMVNPPGQAEAKGTSDLGEE